MPVRQVSGDIALGCRWRVTSLDVLSLQVRGKQEELDYKQELVAIIRDWCAFETTLLSHGASEPELKQGPIAIIAAGASPRRPD